MLGLMTARKFDRCIRYWRGYANVLLGAITEKDTYIATLEAEKQSLEQLAKDSKELNAELCKRIQNLEAVNRQVDEARKQAVAERNKYKAMCKEA